MNRGFLKGMIMGTMAGVAVGTATEMWKMSSEGKKNKMVNKGKRFVNDLME